MRELSVEEQEVVNGAVLPVVGALIGAYRVYSIGSKVVKAGLTAMAAKDAYDIGKDLAGGGDN